MTVVGHLLESARSMREISITFLSQISPRYPTNNVRFATIDFFLIVELLRVYGEKGGFVP